ncbi:MAG: phosphoribosyltransferase [Kiritimatiellia bacterium]|jgi:hypoxanthine phosphoribosyltransferase
MATSKIYVSANRLTRDSFRLARMVYDSGWKPDLLIGIWRGGTPIAVAVHEFLRVKGLKLHHIAMKCSSYAGMSRLDSPVNFEYCEEILDSIAPDTRVLLVDDVFDSGRTMKACSMRLRAIPADVRIATVFWKPDENLTDIQPDFYVNALNNWIVFPHELEGLSDEEIRIKDPVVSALLRGDPEPCFYS